MTSILNKYSNLTQRIIAALLGAIIIITGLSYGPWTFFVVFLCISILTQLEFYKLVGLDGMLPLKTFGTICGSLIFSLTFFIEMGYLDSKFYYLIFPVVACVYLIYLYKKTEKKPFTGVAFTFLGIIYVVIPFSLLNIIAFRAGSYNFQLILGTLLILWAHDTGAYFAGVRFGKRKLFERVSPKKSWEGSVGGALLAFAMAYGLFCLAGFISMFSWFCIAMIIIITGTYGDLVESLLKRSIEIKDSGRSIPGHGGFLDRFDGLLISVPFITAFLKIF